MGDHGLMLKHGLHYEGVLRVPFIWADPTTVGQGRSTVTGSSLDISATILARAGLAPNNGNQGLDVIGLAQGGHNPRQGVLIEEDELGDHLGTETGLRTRSYIQGDWRLTLWQGMAGGQLYDRACDPHELQNQWNDPAAAAPKALMMEGMLREMVRLTDTAPYATHIA
jgi:arylsulfatase A-like enzyme